MKKLKLVYVVISILFVLAFILMPSKDEPEEDQELWTGEKDSDSSWISWLWSSMFPGSMETVLGIYRVSCYHYRKKEDANGNPQRSQLLRAEGQLQARGCKKRLPHALVIGVKKGGTTAILRYMSLHPLVSMAHPVQPGPEINADTVEEWKETFPLGSSKQMSVTGYPGLFTDMQSQLVEMVHSYLPDDLKMILLLRDPVQRLVSDYVHTLTILDRLDRKKRETFVRREGVKPTLEETVLDELGHVNPFASIVRMGIYAIDLRSLLQQIPRERILILDGNVFKEDPFPTLQEVEKFLNLPPFFKRSHFKFDEEKNFYCAQVFGRPDVDCLNAQKGRPHPKVNEELVKKLYDFYRPYNKELEDAFGLKFSWSK